MPKVLVVDDEESLRTLLRTNLESHGYEVDEAANGVEALDRIAQDTPDLVILDTMMPEVDGFDVLDQLRGVSRFRNLPVIMLTAKTAEEDRVRAFTAGAQDFVPKPYYIGELLARVQRAITTAARQRQLVAMSTTDPITGLFNNRYLDSRLRHTFPVTGDHVVCGLLYEVTGLESVIHKHGFKAANDIMGSAGDIVNAWVTDDEQAFAIGGPQILVLSFADKDDVLARGAELQNEIHQVCNFTPGGQGLTVHLAFVASEDGETVESFFYRLESALRDARRASGMAAESEEPTDRELELAGAPGIGPNVDMEGVGETSVRMQAPESAGTPGPAVTSSEQAAPPPVISTATAEQTVPQQPSAPEVQPVQPQMPAASLEGSAWQKAASMELEASAVAAAPPDADELFAQTIAGAREAGQEDHAGEGRPRRRTQRQTLSMRMLSREFSGIKDLGKS